MSLGAVLICKEYSEIYENAFRKRGFTPYFLQVLESKSVNEHLLNQTIQAGSGTKYGAVVITSSRAANSWVSGIKDVLEGQSDESAGNAIASWNEVPFYVVGKATQTALKESDALLPAPLQILGAEKAGTGEKLARYIASTYGETTNSDENIEARPEILYLTGDKNRETLPSILSEAGIKHHKMKVYETESAPELPKRLAETLYQVQSESPEGLAKNVWLVLFSPSTASYVLGASGSMPPIGPTKELPAFKLAAIGPTTEEYLKREGHEVAATSSKPDAESLVEAIYAASQTLNFEDL